MLPTDGKVVALIALLTKPHSEGVNAQVTHVSIIMG